MIQDSTNTWKAFLCLLLFMKTFSLQNIVEMLEEVVDQRSGEYSGWRKTLMFHFWSGGCSMGSRALLRRIGPLCWPAPAAGICSSQCISSICWAYFSDVMVLLGVSRLWWTTSSGSAAGHQSVTMIFWCKFDFGKCFGACSQSSNWAGHLWLSYTIYFLSHITIWSRNGSLYCIE